MRRRRMARFCACLRVSALFCAFLCVFAYRNLSVNSPALILSKNSGLFLAKIGSKSAQNQLKSAQNWLKLAT